MNLQETTFTCSGCFLTACLTRKFYPSFTWPLSILFAAPAFTAAKVGLDDCRILAHGPHPLMPVMSNDHH